jgi:hypothetical protein
MKMTIVDIIRNMVCASFLWIIFSTIFSTSYASINLIISSRDTNTVTIAWPATGLYMLQTNNNLAAPNWGAYNGPITSSNGTNVITIELLAANEFFRLESSGTIGIINPTNISGMAYYWNYNDLPSDSEINSWTDEINGLAMTYNGGGAGAGVSPQTTSAFPGLNIPDYGDSIAFTGSLTPFGSNFTLWVVMRPAIEEDSANEAVFGDGNVYGINISTNILSANWGSGVKYSSMAMNYVNQQGQPYGETYDILDSGGTLYSNGVVMAAGVGRPTNNFPFSAIGSVNPGNGFTAEGYIQYIGIWTNHLLTAIDATNLDYWYWSYGVTNITNGLIAWWKLNDGTGTTATDSVSTNAMYFGGTDVAWTNLASPVYPETICFYGGYLTNVCNTLGSNLPAMTISLWALCYDSFPDEAGTLGGGLITYGATPAPNPGWYVGGDSSNNIMFGVCDTSGADKETSHNSSVPDFPIIGNDGKWHFIVAEYTNMFGTNGITPYIYIDGCQITGELGYDTGNVTNLSNPYSGFAIGGVAEELPGLPYGYISDVRIYNRELSLQEINDLYKWRSQP